MVKRTDILDFSLFWVLIITDLPPFFATFLLGVILKKREVSSMLEKLNFILLSQISYNNIDVCKQQSFCSEGVNISS